MKIDDIMKICRCLNEDGLRIAYNAVLSIHDKKQYSKPYKAAAKDIDAQFDEVINLVGR